MALTQDVSNAVALPGGPAANDYALVKRPGTPGLYKYDVLSFATTASVNAAITTAIGGLVNSAPAALDTLGEIAAQLASDESAAGALTTAVAGKLAKAANLSDLPNPGTARTNLGLGGAALLGVGTAAGTVAAGDDARITGAMPNTIAALTALLLTLPTTLPATAGKLWLNGGTLSVS